MLREKGTEVPFSGKYVDSDDKGMYVCVACGNPLFSSETKFHSESGWPSFWDVVEKGNVKFKEDLSFGMQRVEVLCSKCSGHLGHVFDYAERDRPEKKYYCINSCALDFKAK